MNIKPVINYKMYYHAVNYLGKDKPYRTENRKHKQNRAAVFCFCVKNPAYTEHIIIDKRNKKSKRKRYVLINTALYKNPEKHGIDNKCRCAYYAEPEHLSDKIMIVKKNGTFIFQRFHYFHHRRRTERPQIPWG